MPNTYTFANGRELPVRPVPAYIYEALRIQAEKTLIDEKPQVPTSTQRTDINKTEEVAFPRDPKYLDELKQWETKVHEIASKDFDQKAFLYAIQFDLGDEEEKELREVAKELEELTGLTLNRTDNPRLDYINHILLPTSASKSLFWVHLGTLGIREEDIAAQRRAFPG